MEEQSFVPDYSRNLDEWNDIVAAKDRPQYDNSSFCLDQLMEMSTEQQSVAEACEREVPAWMTPCSLERHIGIDQGVKNFAIVAVDKMPNAVPRVVGAELYDLEREGLRSGRFSVSDLVLVLQSKTVLMNWMQLSGYALFLPHVDRVVVHIEQLSVKHKHSKQFSLELGQVLQQLADVRNCVVKLSQPHVHKAGGPLFKLGECIIKSCRLEPVIYSPVSRGSRKRPAGSKPAGPRAKQTRRAVDLEPDSNSDSDTSPYLEDNDSSRQYRRKKRMSSDIFRYFMHAGINEQADLQVDIAEAVQLQWRNLEGCGLVKKFDDLGDALLHSLNEILCGSSNYRPLIPSNPSLNVNRSVVVTVMPHQVFWIVLHCTCNVFTLEDMGACDTHLAVDQLYSSMKTVETVLRHLNPSLKQAMQQFTGSNVHTAVDHIKVIVKQLRGYTQQGLSNKAAGALTSASVRVMRKVCDEGAGDDSRLCVHNTKQEGWSYARFLSSGQKLQVVRSTGKHTNAILAFMEWAKEHISQFVKNRPLHFSRAEKWKFFSALRDLCSQDIQGHQMERLHVSDHVAGMLNTGSFPLVTVQQVLSDLILVGLNKNGQYVSALAPNYRVSTRSTCNKKPSCR